MNEPGLALIQKWMQTVITAQGSMDQKLNLAHHFFQTGAEELIVSTEKMPAARRLSIYADGYVARLLECMQADYPLLRQFMDDEAFHAFASAYLLRYPSGTYTLYELGAKFPDFLQETRPDTTGMDEEMQAMLDFPAALARLERARAELYRAPGVEKAPPPAMDYFSGALFGGEQWVELTAAVRLLRLPFPLAEYALEADRGEQPEVPSPEESFLAVSRWHYRISLLELKPWQWHFLNACVQPVPVHEAARVAAECTGASTGSILAEMMLWLPDAAERALVSLSAPVE